MAERRASVSAVRLPGVGERLDVRDTSDHVVQAVRRNDGRVELHRGPAVIELDEHTASVVGAFITGHYAMGAELAERTGDVLGGLVFDWVTLHAGDHAVGRTIDELAVRRRTGVTIVAILRGSVPIVGPSPAARLEAGDDLVVVCREQDLDGLVAYLSRGG